MLKKLFTLIFCFFVLNLKVSAETYRASEIKQLNNGVTVVFLDTHQTDNCYVTMCLSVGKSDDLDKSGKATLLGNIFAQNIKHLINNNIDLHHIEMASFIGQDQSLFSFLGKSEDLIANIKLLADHFYNLQFSENQVDHWKKQLEAEFNQQMLLDKNKLRQQALQTLYWHNSLGKPFSVTELKSITIEDLQKFHINNYTNNRITLIISGYTKNKDLIIKTIEESFCKKNSSVINRLKEPDHHNTTVKFCINSSQIKFPIVEIYWRIPCYKTSPSVYDKEEPSRTVSPFALDLFFRYLNKELKKSLIDELKVASSIDIMYSLWNYGESFIRISIILNNKTYSQETEFEILNEIKKLAFEINETKLISVRNELSQSADVFSYSTNIIDTINWLSEKIVVGYEYKFLKEYQKSVKNFELTTVKEEVVKFFKKDPSVISVLNPGEEK